MTEFVNRSAELDRLRDLYVSDAAELGVVFGRRRLGKTALVRHSLRDRSEAIVYQARQKTKSLQLEQFVELASEAYPDLSDVRRDWEPVLGYLGTNDAIVVLDEFPYLVGEDESLPSVLQALFDTEFEDTATTFVLVGSSIAMMEDAALLGNSPLYGRSSLKLDLRQLPFDASMRFFASDSTPVEQVSAWGILGGVPYYLEEMAPDATLGENIRRTILSRHGSLHSEPDYVLRMELTEPTRYFSILEAIAGGNTTRNEIAGAAGIEYNQLSTYLGRLERLRLVDRQVPITEQTERSKRGRYRLRDHLFRFWFRFVYGSGDRFDRFEGDAYNSLVEPELSAFLSRPFEELCGLALPNLYPDRTITDVGQWWYDGREIDVVGLTDGSTVVVGECKFQEGPLGYDTLSQLESDVEELRWTPGNGTDRRHEFALFSKGGFTRSVEDAAVDRDDLCLFTIDAVVDALRSSGR